jgi:hypothetical protein
MANNEGHAFNPSTKPTNLLWRLNN